MNEFIRLMQSQAAPPGTAAPREKAPQVAAREAPEKQTKEGEVDFSDAQELGNGLNTDLSEARRLHQAGFKLCKLVALTKQPEGKDWNNSPVMTIDDSATGYGVILAANGLASVDPDRLADSRSIMRTLGFDLDEVMAEGARTASTRPGSGGRSVFGDPGGLRWIRFSFHGLGTVLELRATSPNLQDVIPGLTYKDKTGAIRTQRFANEHRIDDRRAMPERFAEFWRRCSTDLEFLRERQRLAGEALGLRPMLSVSGGQKLAYPSPYRREFNSLFGHEAENVLIAHGYRKQRHGGRLAALMAEGSPSVRLIRGHDDLWQSDHASDPLQGTFDRWTILVVLEHGDDLKAAEAAAKERIGQSVAMDFNNLVADGVHSIAEEVDTWEWLGPPPGIDSDSSKAADVRSKLICVGATVDQLDALRANDAAAYDKVQALMQRFAIGAEDLRPLPEAAKGDKQTIDLDIDAPASKAGDPARFKFERALDFANSGRPPGWRVKGLVPLSGIAVVYGVSGRGKTITVLDMAASISLGKDWCGMKVKQGRVAYVVAEGVEGFRLRVRAYVAGHGLTDEQCHQLSNNLLILPATPNLLENKDAHDLLKGIEAAGGADLIVIDTLPQAMAGGNENTGEDVGRVLGYCKRIVEATGGVVMFVHHPGKDLSKGARGWSGLRAAADAEIEVTGEAGSNVISARATKVKDGQDGTSFHFERKVITLGVDEDLDSVTSCIVVPTSAPVAKKPNGPTNKDEVVAYSAAQGMLTSSPAGIEVKALVTESAARMPAPDEGKRDRRRDKAKRAVDRLVKDGWLIEKSDGRLAMHDDEEEPDDNLGGG